MPTLVKQTIGIEGMSCASCAARIERGLRGLPGVETADVNFALGRATVAYDPATASFTIRYRATGYLTGVTKTLGGVRDSPVPADYDSDGKADLAVFRPSAGTYFILTASSGFASQITRDTYGTTPAARAVLSR